MKNSSNEKRNLSQWKSMMQKFLEMSISKIISDRIPLKKSYLKDNDNEKKLEKSKNFKSQCDCNSPLSVSFLIN
jgi:hypothetical protein